MLVPGPDAAGDERHDPYPQAIGKDAEEEQELTGEAHRPLDLRPKKSGHVNIGQPDRELQEHGQDQGPGKGPDFGQAGFYIMGVHQANVSKGWRSLS